MHLSNEFVNFFKELAPNNHSEWFNANRKRYENHVKTPFQSLVGSLIDRLAEVDPLFKGIKPSDCIFRINRDIRFSKDKTPYKLSASAAIAPGGRKNMTYPGFYFEAGPEGIQIYSGVYMPDKQQLEAIRQRIASNLKKFENLIKASDFVQKFNGEILGEKQVRLAPELKEAAAVQPIILNKQFYYQASLGPEYVTRNDLIEVLTEYYKAAKPVNAFLAEAL